MFLSLHFALQPSMAGVGIWPSLLGENFKRERAVARFLLSFQSPEMSKLKNKKSVNHKIVGMLKVKKPLQLLWPSSMTIEPAGLTFAFKYFLSITTCPKSDTRETESRQKSPQ